MKTERSNRARKDGSARRGRKTVLVFGSDGMLGSEVVERFGRTGGKDGRSPAWTVIRADADITDERSVDEAVGKARPDVVVNCAGMTNVDGCETDQLQAYAVNAVGPANLARACRLRGVPLFVHVSTDYVFSDDAPGPRGRPAVHRDDSASFRPANAYGLSKLAGEKAVENEYAGRKGAADYLVVRTSRLYGKRRNNFVDFICDICLGKKRPDRPVGLLDGNFSVPTSAAFLADALFRIADGRVLRRRPARSGAPARRNVAHVVNPFRTARDVPSQYGYADKVFEILSRLGMKPARRFKAVAFGRAAAPADGRRTARRPFSSILAPSAEETRGGRFWDEEIENYVKEKFAHADQRLP